MKTKTNTLIEDGQKGVFSEIELQGKDVSTSLKEKKDKSFSAQRVKTIDKTALTFSSGGNVYNLIITDTLVNPLDYDILVLDLTGLELNNGTIVSIQQDIDISFQVKGVSGVIDTATSRTTGSKLSLFLTSTCAESYISIMGKGVESLDTYDNMLNSKHFDMILIAFNGGIANIVLMVAFVNPVYMIDVSAEY